jgi:predicted dehydrogenase
LHARILDCIGDAELVAACDPSPVARAKAADQIGIPSVLETVDELLAVPNLDAVFIVTPEDLHSRHALAAIERGLPVFMEKPLGTSAADAAAIINAARGAGVFLQVGFVLRFDAQHALIKSRIAEDRFGDLVTIRCKRNCSREWFAGYGERAHTVHKTMIHDIDLVLWFTGSRVERLYALDRNISGLTYPDALVTTLKLRNGTIATLETSWFVPPGAAQNVLAGDWVGTIDAELEIVGTEQSARYRLLDSGLTIASRDAVQQPEVGLWPEVYGSIGGALRLEDEHFIDCVRSRQPSPIASIDDAFHGLEVAEAIVRSATEGTEIML